LYPGTRPPESGINHTNQLDRPIISGHHRNLPAKMPGIGQCTDGTGHGNIMAPVFLSVNQNFLYFNLSFDITHHQPFAES
jgi:hypothetical protein